MLGAQVVQGKAAFVVGVDQFVARRRDVGEHTRSAEGVQAIEGAYSLPGQAASPDAGQVEHVGEQGPGGSSSDDGNARAQERDPLVGWAGGTAVRALVLWTYIHTANIFRAWSPVACGAIGPVRGSVLHRGRGESTCRALTAWGASLMFAKRTYVRKTNKASRSARPHPTRRSTMPLLSTADHPNALFSGEWIPAHGGNTEVVSPSTGTLLGHIGTADAHDVNRAAARAARTQRDWAAASFEERATVLRRAGDLIHTHADEIGHWLRHEGGAAAGMAAFQGHVAAQEGFEAAALAHQPHGEILRTAKPRLSFSRQVPAGVVGVIASFNVPLILGIRSVAPALALGNAVVLKPDQRTA